MTQQEAEDLRQIGPFVPLRQLGTDRFGTVFHARDINGASVAVQVASANLACHPMFRERFAAQVTVSSSARGPGIASWVAAGPHDPRPWLAVEYLPGPSLADAVGSGGVLPPECAHALARRLAAALSALHGANLAHHNLALASVILTPHNPYLIDFGIARAAEGLLAGTEVGSREFPSPEQAQGEPGGFASDVFGLASVVVFAAGGGVPVHGVSDLACLPEDLRKALRPCLHPEPAARPTAAQLAEYLARSMRTPMAWPPPRLAAPAPVPEAKQTLSAAPGRPRGNALVAGQAAAIIAVIVLAGLLVYHGFLGSGPAPGGATGSSVSSPAPPDPRVSALAVSGGEGIALSRNGARLYAGSNAPGRLSAVDTASNSVLYSVPLESGLNYLLLSPDEQRIYLLYSSGEIHVHRAGDGAEIDRVDLPGGLAGTNAGAASAEMALSPDGGKLYVPYGDSATDRLAVIDTTTFTYTDIGLNTLQVRAVALTPGGARVLVVAMSTAGDEIKVIDTGASRVTGVIPGQSHTIALAPDGVTGYVTDGILARQIASVDIPGLRRGPGFDVLTPALHQVNSLLVSPDGRYLYAGMVAEDRKGTLVVVETAGHRVVDRIALPHIPQDLAISPDGRRLYAGAEFNGKVHSIDISAPR